MQLAPNVYECVNVVMKYYAIRKRGWLYSAETLKEIGLYKQRALAFH